MKFPTLRSSTGRVKAPDEQLTLTEHLAELRVRIIRSALAIATGMLVIVIWYDPVLNWLRRPYTNLCLDDKDMAAATANCTLVSLGPLDAFGTRFRIAMWGGLVLALPVVMWQIWRFVVPALHAKEKKYAVPFILSSLRPHTHARLVDSTRLSRIAEGPERRAATLRDQGIDVINMHHSDWTGGLAVLFHRFERLAFGWDLQLPRQLTNALRMGLDGVYSDHVDRMDDAFREVGAAGDTRPH